MTAVEATPECSLDEHAMCDGPGEVRRQGAPAWEAPLMTIKCGCDCHGRHATRPTASKERRR